MYNNVQIVNICVYISPSIFIIFNSFKKLIKVNYSNRIINVLIIIVTYLYMHVLCKIDSLCHDSREHFYKQYNFLLGALAH